MGSAGKTGLKYQGHLPADQDVVKQFSSIFIKAEGKMAYQSWLFKVSLVPLLCLFWLLGVSPPLGAQGNGNLPRDLQNLVAEALKANPEVKQMSSLHTASRESAKSAGALDDPEFAFIAKDIPTDSWSFNQEDMTQKMIELSQKLDHILEIGRAHV